MSVVAFLLLPMILFGALGIQLLRAAFISLTQDLETAHQSLNPGGEGLPQLAEHLWRS